jgi:hypothetical protein
MWKGIDENRVTCRSQEGEKNMIEKLEKPLVGACGVFYVSAELSRKNWIAMPTIRNTSGIDIIATKDDKVVNIQVKTNSYGKIKYLMNKSNEELIDDNLYYVFVTLKDENERPDFYILPSRLVANYIKETQKKWVHLKPRRRPMRADEKEETTKKRRETTTMRQFPNYIGKSIPSFKDFEITDYRDKWEKLEK